MKRLITGDEARMYEYDVETSQQSREWHLQNEAKPKKFAKIIQKLRFCRWFSSIFEV